MLYYIRKRVMYGSAKKNFTTTNDIFDSFIRSLYLQTKGIIEACSFSPEDIIGSYIRGKILECNKPWFAVDDVLMPVNIPNRHWFLLRLNFPKRQLLICDSVRNEGHDEEVLELVKAYAVLLPIYLDICDVWSHKIYKGRLKSLNSREPLDVFHVNDLSRQEFRDCGIFTLAFAEYFSLNKRKFPNPFNVEGYRMRLTCLLYHYGRIKQLDGYASDVDIED